MSIVFVGVEIVKLQRGQVGLTARYPWVVAFAFGLLHGLGFATALTTLGIPQATLPIALLFFNVGVEIGQLAFVFVVLALIWAHRQAEATLPRWGAALPAYAIGSVAAFWFLARGLNGPRPPTMKVSEDRDEGCFASSEPAARRACLRSFRSRPRSPTPAPARRSACESGFLHPITGLDHLVAMVAVGLWGAQLGNPAIWVLPITFPLVMALGGLLGIAGVPLPLTEPVVALSGIALGLLIALHVRLPLWLAVLAGRRLRDLSRLCPWARTAPGAEPARLCASASSSRPGSCICAAS